MLKEKDVFGDGNCLFRSVSLLLDGSENNYRKYRDISCKSVS